MADDGNQQDPIRKNAIKKSLYAKETLGSVAQSVASQSNETEPRQMKSNNKRRSDESRD